MKSDPIEDKRKVHPSHEQNIGIRIFDPRLACEIGLGQAIVLYQMHYWVGRSKKVHEGQKWFYCTYEGWQAQFPFWSKRTIQDCIRSLKEMELVFIGTFNTNKWNRTRWYSINYNHEILLNAHFADMAKPAASMMQKLPHRYGKTCHFDKETPATCLKTKTTPKITSRDYNKEAVVVDKTDLEWLKGKPERFREAVEDYVTRQIAKRDDVRNPGGYRRGIIRNIRDGTAKDFDPDLYDEWEEATRMMLGGSK